MEVKIKDNREKQITRENQNVTLHSLLLNLEWVPLCI